MCLCRRLTLLSLLSSALLLPTLLGTRDGSGGGEDETTGRFAFSFEESGLLSELNFSSGAPRGRRIVWDERGRYGPAFVQHWPHKQSGSDVGWTVRTSAETDEHSCAAAEIDTALLESSTASAKVRSNCSSLLVVDTFDFSGPQIRWNFTVTNLLQEHVELVLPVNLGGLQIGHLVGSHGLDLSDTGLHRLRPEAGGRLELPWNQTGNYNNYPGALNVFSPIALLGENDEGTGMTVAMMWMSELELPTNVTFKELPRNQFNPTMVQELGTTLRAGESREFSVVVAAEVGGTIDARWKRAVAPYKALLEAGHGKQPAYCPRGPTAYLVAENAGSSPIQLNKTAPDYHRFFPGSKYADVFSSTTAPALMAAAGVNLYGVWQTAVYSALVTEDGSSCEFMPNIDLIAPNLDAGPNRTVLDAFTQQLHQHGVTPFHFARPCLEVKGASITYDSLSRPVFTKGTTTTSDLTSAGGGAAERYMARLAEFVGRGFGGFYLDAMSCPGDTEFLSQVMKRWPHLFLMKEGCRDRDAYKWPQIPILKLPDFPANNSLLMQELRPLATYYGGAIDNPLSDDEFAQVLDDGYIGVVSNTPAAFEPRNRVRFLNSTCGFIQRSLDNQAKLHDSYGKALGCAPPAATNMPCTVDESVSA